jgi:uncharacterized membrane protein YfbV (UPF0208 family)
LHSPELRSLIDSIPDRNLTARQNLLINAFYQCRKIANDNMITMAMIDQVHSYHNIAIDLLHHAISKMDYHYFEVKVEVMKQKNKESKPDSL